MDLLMWREVKEEIRRKRKLTRISYDTWIEPLHFSIEGNNKIYIIVPADMKIAKQFVEVKYGETFQSTLCEYLGYQVEVEFVIGKYQ